MERKILILNFSLIPKDSFKKALKIIKEVFRARFSLGHMVAVIEEGEEIGGIIVPHGKIGLGTICSVTLHGICLKRVSRLNQSLVGSCRLQKNH